MVFFSGDRRRMLDFIVSYGHKEITGRSIIRSIRQVIIRGEGKNPVHIQCTERE